MCPMVNLMLESLTLKVHFCCVNVYSRIRRKKIKMALINWRPERGRVIDEKT